MTPKTWTLDNRPIVWTACERNKDRYNLYFFGKLVGESLSFEDFYPLYNSCRNKLKQKAAA